MERELTGREGRRAVRSVPNGFNASAVCDRDLARGHTIGLPFVASRRALRVGSSIEPWRRRGVQWRLREARPAKTTQTTPKTMWAITLMVIQSRWANVGELPMRDNGMTTKFIAT